MKKYWIGCLISTLFLLPSAFTSLPAKANLTAKINESLPAQVNRNAKIYLKSIKFSKNRLLVAMKRWGEIKLSITAESGNPNAKWVDDCRIKLYIGYNGLGKDGKMLAFKSSCKIFTLPTATEQNIYFYIPGDLRKRYNLTKDPDFYTVRITADGTKMLLGEKECSKSLEYHKKERSFIKKSRPRPIYLHRDFTMPIKCHPMQT
jgi:hypothetical protein